MCDDKPVVVTMQALKDLNTAHEACLGWAANMGEQRSLEERKVVQKMYDKVCNEYREIFIVLTVKVDIP